MRSSAVLFLSMAAFAMAAPAPIAAPAAGSALVQRNALLGGLFGDKSSYGAPSYGSGSGSGSGVSVEVNVDIVASIAAKLLASVSFAGHIHGDVSIHAAVFARLIVEVFAKANIDVTASLAVKIVAMLNARLDAGLSLGDASVYVAKKLGVSAGLVVSLSADIDAHIASLSAEVDVSVAANVDLAVDLTAKLLAHADFIAHLGADVAIDAVVVSHVLVDALVKAQIDVSADIMAKLAVHIGVFLGKGHNVAYASHHAALELGVSVDIAAGIEVEIEAQLKVLGISLSAEVEVDGGVEVDAGLSLGGLLSIDLDASVNLSAALHGSLAFGFAAELEAAYLDLDVFVQLFSGSHYRAKKAAHTISIALTNTLYGKGLLTAKSHKHLLDISVNGLAAALANVDIDISLGKTLNIDVLVAALSHILVEAGLTVDIAASITGELHGLLIDLDVSVAITKTLSSLLNLGIGGGSDLHAKFTADLHGALLKISAFKGLFVNVGISVGDAATCVSDAIALKLQAHGSLKLELVAKIAFFLKAALKGKHGGAGVDITVVIGGAVEDACSNLNLDVSVIADIKAEVIAQISAKIGAAGHGAGY
ncbi:hypothetical protein EDC01DRAFT_656932 [Geopyxis carbonaria]|nr:hypothetical protein EDC01DRAFT_656932 [Geopyxis carbonaria]